MVIVVLVLFGLIFGSFVNALVWRLHTQEEIKNAKDVKHKTAKLRDLSMWHGRSMCSKCRHPLGAKDLVPLVSWLWLQGKCRYCHDKIEDPPIVEAVMPLLFAGSYIVWPNGFHGWGLVAFCFWLVFLVGFVALALYDFRWFELPDVIVYSLIGVALLQLVIHCVFFGGGWQVIAGAAWGVLIASGIFFVLYQLSDGAWIGGGDVKLGVVLGILVGGPLHSILLLFLASLLGTLASIPLLVKSKAGRKTLIPFGPFLLGATVLIELFGTVFFGWLNQFIG